MLSHPSPDAQRGGVCADAAGTSYRAWFRRRQLLWSRKLLSARPPALTHLVPSKHVLVEQWAPTGLKAIIPFQSGVLNVSDQAPGNESRTDLRAEMTGRSAEELTSALASTPVDPKAAPYMSLPPDERYQLAQAS